jgi:hypothetical protein
MGEDIKLENYRKTVERILDDWTADAIDIGKKLAPIQAELEKLQATDPPNPADKKRIDELKKKCAELHQQMANVNASLDVNFVAIAIPPKADEKELAKIPPWIKDIIKRKGVALGKKVTLAPTVDIDFKAKKVKSFGIKITW